MKSTKISSLSRYLFSGLILVDYKMGSFFDAILLTCYTYVITYNNIKSIHTNNSKTQRKLIIIVSKEKTYRCEADTFSP